MNNILLLISACTMALFAYGISLSNHSTPSETTELNAYPQLMYDSLNKKVFVYDSFYVFIDSSEFLYTETYLKLNSLDHTLLSVSNASFLDFTPYFPADLLLEKIWEPKKYPDSKQCNHLRNRHDEFFVIDERGYIQMYAQRVPSGEHKLVMQTENPPYCDYWRQILPAFYKAPPYSEIKASVTYALLAKTNWFVTKNNVEIRFTDDVFGTMDDEKKFYTKGDAFNIEFQLHLNVDRWNEDIQLIIEEDSAGNTKILNIDFVLNDHTPSTSDEPIGYIPTAEEFYSKQYHSKVNFDSFDKILIRFNQRSANEFYDEQRIFLPCGSADEYEIVKISNN